MFKKLASLLFEEEAEVQVEELDPVQEDESAKSLIASMNPDAPTKSIEIQKLDLVIEPEPLPKESSTFIDVEQPVQEKRVTSTYEFRPVMSPMFGVSEKDKQMVVKKPIEIKPQPSTSSRINTIISPIYGDLKQEHMRVEVDKTGLKVAFENPDIDEHVLEKMDIETILKPTFEVQEVIETPITEDVELSYSDEEVDALTDIEALQFSLFDDGNIEKL